MQHLDLVTGEDDTRLVAYHDHLQSDHDYRIKVDVLTMEEVYVDTMGLLDGQINFNNAEDGPDRTATVTLSDPLGALDFGESYMYDPKGIIWANRLLGILHEVTVPGVGEVRTACGVYLPTAVSRDSAEVSLELGDKSLLADHGVRPRTYKMGMRVDLALRAILEECTGEKHFRIPPTTATLSKPYTVGMGEDTLTPWRAFKKMAAAEMSWRAYYDGEGFAVCEPFTAVKSSVVVKSMLALPSASASLSEFSNYAKVTSHRKPANKKGKKKTKGGITLIHDSVVALTNNHILSEESLNRHDVPRTLPIVEINDDLKDLDATLKRAEDLLTDNSGLSSNRSFEIIPLFHLEPFERVDLPDGVGKQVLAPASIPLGVGGNMTVGAVKWVSKPLTIKKIRSATTVQKAKKKGGKK